MSIDRVLESRIWPVAWGFFSRLFILAGLSLLAWGPDDLAGFFSNPARAGLIALVIVHSLVLAGVDYLTPPRPEHGDRHDPSFWHAHLSEGIYILAAYGDRRGVLAWDDSPLRWAGLGIYLIGSVISIWGNITWSRYLRTQPERAVDGPVLLVEGPFKFLRYPSLLVLGLYSLGSTIVFRSWLGLALMVPLIGSIMTRANELDRINAEEYRYIWPVRTQKSKRVIPFVY